MSVGYQTEVYMSVPQQPTNDPKPTWINRTANSLSDRYGVNVEEFTLAMEAAAEMKCVALKIALARCYEVLAIADKNNASPQMDDGFLEVLLELFR